MTALTANDIYKNLVFLIFYIYYKNFNRLLLTYLDSVGNILILSCYSFYIRQEKFVYSDKVKVNKSNTKLFTHY